MPELPEVETVVRSLNPLLRGKILIDYRSLWPRVLENIKKSKFKRSVLGKKIKRVKRRAKYIILELESGFILIHLRMTGKLNLLEQEPVDTNHISALFNFTDGHILQFYDVRRFGRIYYCANETENDEFFQRFGPEPLATNFTNDWLFDSLNKRKRAMKALLLDQHFISGLGNIYVDEVLWHARIHPESHSRNIKHKKAYLLHQAIQSVLRDSIKVRGTTFMNFSFLSGKTGGYKKMLRVFGRQGEPCPRCKTKIEKKKIAGRGTHWCPRCQRKGAS